MRSIFFLVVFVAQVVWSDQIATDLLGGQSASSAKRAHRSRIEQMIARTAPLVTEIDGPRFREYRDKGTGIVKGSVARIRSVFPDYDPSHELLVAIREVAGNGNLHAFLMFRGMRYDGGWFREPSYPPTEVELIDRGVVFRFQGIPSADLDRMEAKIRAGNPRIVELNCYSSFLKFIEDNSSLSLNRPYSNIPLYPSEHIDLLVQGQLTHRESGQRFTPRIYNSSKAGFSGIIQGLLSQETDAIDQLAHACSSLAKSGVSDPQLVPNYRQLLGLTP